MNDRRLLRTEAQPLPWEILTEDQQHGFERLLLTIQAAVEALPDPSEIRAKKRLPWLFRESVSKLVFVDGNRGTGKTSLLLSLVGVLTEATTCAQAELQSVVDQIRQQVIILEPLDMEPLPSGTPILSAILARVDRAAQQLGVSRQAQRGLMDEDLGHNREYRRFAQLKSQIARSLNGNLGARMASLDREQYGIEVMKQEEDRLQLRSMLDESLRLLSDLIPMGSGAADSKPKQKLFLVPIDDVDLNPKRCLELLRLVRHYPAQNLFYLLLGQHELVREIVKLTIGNEFHDAGDPDAALASVDSDRLRRDLAEIAIANTQKLIPNTVALAKLPLRRVLDFKPLVGDKPDSKSLGDLFDQIDLDVGSGPSQSRTLRELLDVAKTDSVTKPDELRGTDYPGIGALHVTPRRLVDLHRDISNVLVETEAKPESSSRSQADADSDHRPAKSRLRNQRVLEVFEEHVKELVDEDANLNDHLKDRLRRDRLTGFEFVRKQADHSEEFRLTQHALEGVKDASYDPILRIEKAGAVPELVIKQDRVKEKPGKPCPQTICGLILINDLRRLLNVERTDSVFDDIEGLQNLSRVSVSWIAETPVYWGLPRLRTYADLVTFFNETQQVTSSNSDKTVQAPEVDGYVRKYAYFGYRLLRLRRLKFDIPEWPELVEKLNRLRTSSKVTLANATQWLSAVLLFTMPEACGIEVCTKRRTSLGDLEEDVQDAITQLERLFESHRYELSRGRQSQMSAIYERSDQLWNQLNDLMVEGKKKGKGSWVFMKALEPTEQLTRRMSTQMSRLEQGVAQIDQVKQDVASLGSGMEQLQVQLNQDNAVKQFESATRQAVVALESDRESPTVFLAELEERANEVAELADEHQDFASVAVDQINTSANKILKAGGFEQTLTLMSLSDGLAESKTLARRQLSAWFELGKWSLDKRLFRQSEALWRRRLEFSESRPESKGQRASGVSHAFLGDVYRDTGRVSKAEVEYQSYFAIFKRLTEADPDNKNWRRNLGLAHSRLGDVYRDTDRLSEAEAEHQSYFAISKRLTEAYPDDNYPLRDLGHAHLRLGDVYQERDRLTEAEAEYQSCLSIFKRLTEVDPDDKDFQLGLGIAHSRLGEVFQQLNDARKAINELIASEHCLMAEGVVTNTRSSLHLAITKWLLSKLVDDTDRAETLVSAAVELFGDAREKEQYFFPRARRIEQEMRKALETSKQERAGKKSAAKKTKKKRE